MWAPPLDFSVENFTSVSHAAATAAAELSITSVHSHLSLSVRAHTHSHSPLESSAPVSPSGSFCADPVEGAAAAAAAAAVAPPCGASTSRRARRGCARRWRRVRSGTGEATRTDCPGSWRCRSARRGPPARSLRYLRGKSHVVQQDNVGISIQQSITG